MKLPDCRRGFTLIEVLVALAIVAFGLTALFTATNQTVRASSYLREKTLAQWIALNHITEMRLTGQIPTDKETGGELEYAHQSWRWQLKVIPTPVDGILRLEARVGLSSAPDGSWTGLATGFMGSAIAPPGGPGVNWLGDGTPRGGQPRPSPGPGGTEPGNGQSAAPQQ